MTPSFLICEKMDFDISNIENEIDSLYESDVEIRQRHNMILSIEDGLLIYYQKKNSQTNSHPMIFGENLKGRFVFPRTPLAYAHFKVFCTSLFLMSSQATILYPEITHYLGVPGDGGQRNGV